MENSRKFWIKHPPDEVDADNPPAFLADDCDDVFFDQRLQLQLFVSLHRFEKTGNPYYAVKVFLLCQRVGIFPPKVVLEWIEDSFLRWIVEDGLMEMSKAMGLAKGRGQAPAIKKAKAEIANEQLMLEIAQLKTIFKISALDAAALVSARLAETVKQEDCSSFEKPYDSSTLNVRFSRWNTELKRSEYSYDHWTATEEQKRDFASRYPQYSFLNMTPMERFLNRK